MVSSRLSAVVVLLFLITPMSGCIAGDEEPTTPTPVEKESDIDNDGIPDSEDDDIDGDGINNQDDPDDDNDGIPDDQDTTIGDVTTPGVLPAFRTVQRSSPYLRSYDACAALLTDLKQSISDEMRTNLEQQRDFANGNYWRGGMTDDVMMMDGDVAVAESADTGGAPTSGGSQSSDENLKAGEDFTGTNNQEEGVDEADFIKTDGHHIYLLNGGHLFIMAVPEFGQITHLSNVSIQGTPTQMLMSDDRIVVASTVNVWSLPPDDPLRTSALFPGETSHYRWSSFTKLTVVEITDRANPFVADELYIEGYQMTGREVEGTVRMITYGWIDVPGLKTWVDLWTILGQDAYQAYWGEEITEELRNETWNQAINVTILENEAVISSLTLSDLIPRMYVRGSEGNTIQPYEWTSSDCRGFSSSQDASSRGLTSIISIDLTGSSLSFDADHIRSNWPIVYASKDTLLLAEQAADWWWYWGNNDLHEVTNIHSFDISESGQTTYLSSGRINGTVNDQFSLSEYEDTIRVVSTTGQWGRWWMSDPEPMMNHVITLQESFKDGVRGLYEVGHLGGIAPGETLWSARFVGDTAYLVTFEQWDPLWTIDLSDPTNPRIIGELEIPGVSTYIHPMNDGDSLLTIGFPGGEGGIGLDWSRTQISLFDVSNLSDPTLSAALPLTPGYEDKNCEDIRWCGWSWSWSEATYEHKAFTYWDKNGLLAVPLSTHRYVHDTIEEDGRTYTYHGYEYVSKLVLVSVDADNGVLSIYGEVNHSDLYGEGLSSSWWGGDISISRSIFMGDFVYSFSDAGIKVHNVTSLNQTASINLPGYRSLVNQYYFEDEVAVEATVDGEDREEEAKSDDGEATSSGSSGSGDPPPPNADAAEPDGA